MKLWIWANLLSFIVFSLCKYLRKVHMACDMPRYVVALQRAHGNAVTNFVIKCNIYCNNYCNGFIYATISTTIATHLMPFCHSFDLNTCLCSASCVEENPISLLREVLYANTIASWIIIIIVLYCCQYTYFV